MANGNATIIVGSARLGSARLGSARQEHSAVFSACQVLFHTIYNEPVAGDRAHYALASAFFRLPEGWWFDIEVLTTTGKSIFSG